MAEKRIADGADSRRDALEVVFAFWPAKFAPAGGAPVLGHLHFPEEFEKPRVASERLIDRGPDQPRDVDNSECARDQAAPQP